jgi:23S rRNA pseudouridine2605 synthase
VRLNRYLSLCGLGSRRGCEQIILDGRVMVNSKRVTELATEVSDDDHVTVDGKPVVVRAGLVVAFHKPRGYVCTRSDERDRQTIYDLLPGKYQNLHHVGRLDKDSEGLLLLTNQGELTHRLMHPSEGVEKEYEVRLETEFNKDHLSRLLDGVMTEEGYAKAERVWMQNPYVVHIILKQGLKRQIRLMLYALGYEVERLTRTRIGGLLLKGLPRGGWKELTEHQVAHYFKKTESKPAKQPKASSSPASEESDDHFAPQSPARDRDRDRDAIRPKKRRLPEKRRTAPSTYVPKPARKPRAYEQQAPEPGPKTPSSAPTEAKGKARPDPRAARAARLPGFGPMADTPTPAAKKKRAARGNKPSAKGGKSRRGGGRPR